MALCTIADVEAYSGAPTLPADQPRVDRLIDWASAVVTNACVTLPESVPAEVSLVTARLVVRQMANPTSLVSEGIAGYQAAYGPGLVLTDEDVALLGRWASAAARDNAAYSVQLGQASAWWPLDWWQRDWDNVWPYERVLR